jgi:hypothetical protein
MSHNPMGFQGLLQGLFRPEEYVDLSILTVGPLCLLSFWVVCDNFLRRSSIFHLNLKLDIYSEVNFSELR